jgi:malate synthase
MVNLIEGQLNLRDAVRGTISYTNPGNGKVYALREDSNSFVRPRGWHLDEAHVMTVNGVVVSGSIFDFALYCSTMQLSWKRNGPLLLLASQLGRTIEPPCGTTCLWQPTVSGLYWYHSCYSPLETITAAFQMEEILYQLRDHRWD